MRLRDIFVAKITSARFIMALLVTVTLCIAVYQCFQIIRTSMSDEKTFGLVKDIIMFVLGAFTTTVSNIVTNYFNRQDRHVPEEKGGS